jgi:hypothetical protein
VDEAAGHKPVVLFSLANHGRPENEIVDDFGTIEPCQRNDTRDYDDDKSLGKHSLFDLKIADKCYYPP